MPEFFVWVIPVLIVGGLSLIIIGSFFMPEEVTPEVSQGVFGSIQSFIDSIQSFFDWAFVVFFLLIGIVIISWFSNLLNPVYTGPRGGKYRINSKGRKSYDVVD